MAKPTKKQRAYQIRIEKLLQTIERPYAKLLAQEKNRYINKFARNYAIGLPDTEADFELHQTRIAQIMQRFAEKTMPIFAQLQIKNFKSASLRLETKSAAVDLIRDAVNQYMIQYGFKKAVGIADTTRTDIRKVLVKVADNPMSDIDIGKEIRAVTGLTAARAAIIARTETHSASQYAVQIIGNFVEGNLNVELVKAWIPTSDDRTRESHADMDASNYIGIHDAFEVGGEELMYPADPSGSPENIINCRCVQIQEERELT
jgi:hypothetical protein